MSSSKREASFIINLAGKYMDEDKMQELLMDVTSEDSSNCCGAAMYELGEDFICKGCGEHCGVSEYE